jgi:hypothetical protein
VASALKLDGESVPNRTILNLLEDTGTLEMVPMRTVQGPHQPPGQVTAILTGATANWMVRRVQELRWQMDGDLKVCRVIALASNRLCGSDTELGNQFVQDFVQEYGTVPTERQLLNRIIHDHLNCWPEVQVTADGLEQQVRKLAQVVPDLGDIQIYVPTNANATFIPLAIRRVLKEEYGEDFDAVPQFWFSQYSFPLARMPEEAADTARYQRPLTVFSGLVRLLNELHKLK